MEALRGKKIAVLGMGVNNRHLAEYLKSQGIDFDAFQNWGDHDNLLGKLTGYDLVFRSPGLPYLSKPMREAAEAGVEISSQTKLFFDLCPAKIIGVTGTKGKGTTSSLIAAILKAAGMNVWLAGNIGQDPFEFLPQIQPSDIVVMELSSFQLQDLTRSPQIAVMLNITPDHLNHHSTFEEYTDAKSSILRYQTEWDFAVLNPNLSEAIKSLGLGRKIEVDPQSVASWERKLAGIHNLENIAAAAEVARLAGATEEVIKATVATFEALPHRLKTLREVNGVTFIDDGFSTNVEPTIAAIESIEKPQVLIIGGHDKGLDFSGVAEKIKQTPRVKAVVIIGQMTEKIEPLLQGFAGKILTGASDMSQIIDQALSAAEPGDAVVFSPGTSSFGMFKNEHDRADQFVKIVNEL